MIPSNILPTIVPISSTLDLIKEKTKQFGEDEEQAEDKEKDENVELFEKLAQPRIKKVSGKNKQSKEEPKGYHNSEREDINRLIESIE